VTGLHYEISREKARGRKLFRGGCFAESNVKQGKAISQKQRFLIDSCMIILVKEDKEERFSDFATILQYLSSYHRGHETAQDFSERERCGELHATIERGTERRNFRLLSRIRREECRTEPNARRSLYRCLSGKQGRRTLENGPGCGKKGAREAFTEMTHKAEIRKAQGIGAHLGTTPSRAETAPPKALNQREKKTKTQKGREISGRGRTRR